MTAKVYLITTALTTVLLLSAAAYAGGSIGGGGREGMGSGGSGMIGTSPNFSAPRESPQSGRPPEDQQNKLAREKLLDEIR
jgi:hypothetical protein